MKEIIYFTGDLATAREKDHSLDEAATGYYNDCLAGKCTLTQRKLQTSEYEYIACYRNLESANKSLSIAKIT